ncbi:MAG: hypothetical protein ACP5QK_09835 [Myxococcota bacterium]
MPIVIINGVMDVRQLEIPNMYGVRASAIVRMIMVLPSQWMQVGMCMGLDILVVLQ